MSTFKLSPDAYNTIESKISLTGDEDYAVVVQKRHGKATYGVHVFTRQPTTKELMEYEETASRVKYQGTKAVLEGSALLAAKRLYGLLIARAYDIQVGRFLKETLTRDEAMAQVPDLGKREAIREFLGNQTGLTSLTASEEDDVKSGQFSDAE